MMNSVVQVIDTTKNKWASSELHNLQITQLSLTEISFYITKRK